MSVAQSTLNRNDTHHGHSYRLQYAKDFQATDTRFTLAAYRYSTAGFYTFQEANDRRAEGGNKRQKLQLDLSQSVGDYGSLYLSGYQQSFWQEEGYERTLSAGWSSNFSGISYNLAYSYNTYPARAQPAEQQLAFSVQVPLSRFLPNAWASYSLNSARHGDTRQQVGLSGTTLADNNLSYSIQQSHTYHGAGSAGSLSAGYKGGQGEISGGYNYDAHFQQINYGLKGGVVAHPHGITLSQPLGQTLAVLKLDSAPGDIAATGVGVQLYFAPDDRAVRFGQRRIYYISPGGGTETVQFKARYYQTAPRVSAGVASATATFTLTYR